MKNEIINHTHLWSKETIELSTFNSIQDFTDYLDIPDINKGSYNASKHGGEGFTGTKTYEEAYDLLRNGWNVKSEEYTQSLKHFVVTHQKTRPQFSTVGHQASVPRYLQGIPTNMIQNKKVPAPKKIIDLYKDLSYSSGVSSAEISEEGLKALQIVKLLESQGYRVNLTVVWSVRHSGKGIVVLIPIKKATENLNISKVAFPLAHPSMLRRLGFRFLERQTHLSKSWYMGYGTPTSSLIEKVIPKGSFLLPSFIPEVTQFVETLKSI